MKQISAYRFAKVFRQGFPILKDEKKNKKKTMKKIN